MIDLKTATKDELLILFQGLMELNYSLYENEEIVEIKRRKGEFRTELINRGLGDELNND